MKNDIIIAGVGGQGILSIASCIGYSAVHSGLSLKQAETHGMSQRGGDVQSHLRISDKEIFSDLVQLGKADLIISVEPMESLRYLPFLAPEGWVVTNTKAYVNIPNYPKMDELMARINEVKNVVAIDADTIAEEIGNIRFANMVILGATSPFLCLTYDQLKEGIRGIFSRKGEEIVNKNLEALARGREVAMSVVNKK